jgi:asparagine synthase (glutamine-hydrolysing)
VEAYFHGVSIARNDMRRELFSDAFRTRLNGYNAIEIFRRHAQRANVDDPLSLIQYIDLKTYLVGDINTKVDRASMAHSLEVREPLMDHPLLEWLASLPPTLKVRGNEGKFLLKQAMRPYLPADVMFRPKKGFAVPLGSWFRGPLRRRMSDAVLGPRLAATGLFNPRCLKSLVDAHVSGARDFSAPLWSLLMFDAFLKNVMQERVSSPQAKALA